MYGLIDNDRRPIAFHKEKRIIMKYMESYYSTNKEKLIPIKIKRKKIQKYKDYEDLYLVKYGESYIQSKYIYIRQIDIEPLIDDLLSAHDVIIRIIEFTDDDKKCKKLSKALDIIDEEIQRLESEAPSLDELESRNLDYEMYRERAMYGD